MLYLRNLNLYIYKKTALKNYVDGQRHLLPISSHKIGKQYFKKAHKDMRFGKG